MTTPLHTRQRGHLDTDLLAGIHLVRAGLGRDVGQLEMLASTGIGQFTLIDPGVVEPENVGQSGYTWADVGKRKVDAARDHILAFNSAAAVTTIAARHYEVPDLNKLFTGADLVTDGVDDLAVAADVAKIACTAAADVLHIRTTGNSQQFVITGTLRRRGVPGCVRCRLKGAFDTIERGYTPPDHFPSFRLVPERLNVHAAWVTLGLLHHRQGSSLAVADIGARFLAHPAWVGLNGIDPASGEIFPIHPYREPIASDWTCPVCGTSADALGPAMSWPPPSDIAALAAAERTPAHDQGNQQRSGHGLGTLPDRRRHLPRLSLA